MKGDFTRSPYRPEKHYSSVRQQQGRVWLDSDWNEQVEIQDHLEQIESSDVIGCCGVPKYGGGYALTPIGTRSGHHDLLISPGRIYVHGVLCELFEGTAVPAELARQHTITVPTREDVHVSVDNLIVDGRSFAVDQWVELFHGEASLGIARIASISGRILGLEWSNPRRNRGISPPPDNLHVRRLTSYLTQPDYPHPHYSLPTDTQPFTGTLYLDVWQRHLTAVEAPDIREGALGGPDTTTRTRTIAQVKLQPGRTTEGPPPKCNQLGRCWVPDGTASSARLRARAEPSPISADPCKVPARAGYRRLENQLYRVEIHAGGTGDNATFKWSRDNGSVIYPVASVDPAQRRVTLAQAGRDRYLSLHQDDWVELVDDNYTLRGEVQPLLQVEKLNENSLVVTLRSAPADNTGQNADRHPLLRRWDHGHVEWDQGHVERVSLSDGAIPLSKAEGTWFPLEDGVEICFEPGGHYQPGDYWTIPARTAINDTIGDVLWPCDGDEPRFETRHGTEHHYCALGVLTATRRTWKVDDCRQIFSPLTEVKGGGCCVDVRPGEDIRQAIATVLAAGGGRVCLCAGLHTLAGALELDGAQHLTIAGQGSSTFLRLLPARRGSQAGIVLRGCAHVSFEDMVLTSEQATALITVYAGERSVEDASVPRGEPSHKIGMRRMMLVNLPQPTDSSTFVRCAVRLADAADVLIEECRIAAPFGIVSLFGEQLPQPQELESQDGGQIHQVTFDGRQAGRLFSVGARITSGDISAPAQTFTLSNGNTDDQGYAQVERSRSAGGSSYRLSLNNINLAFDSGSQQWREVTVQFEYGAGNLNLQIDRVLLNVDSPVALNQTVGSVAVTCTMSAAGNQAQGTIRLVGVINRFAIGGQEFWLDSLTFVEEAAPVKQVDYGEGVTALQVIRSHIRYADVGIFALRADDWLIADCDLRGIDLTSTATARVARPGDTLATHQAWLHWLDETVFAPDPHGDGGTALYAYVWHNCEVRDCRIESGDAIITWLWVGGGAHGNTVLMRRLGIFAAWLQQAGIEGNSISDLPPMKQGSPRVHSAIFAPGLERSAALVLGASHRARLERNTLRCDVGLRNVPLRALFDEIGLLVDFVGMLYGASATNVPNPPMSRLVIWMLLEELARLTGLQQMRVPLQALLGSVTQAAAPVLLLVAEWIAELLARQQSIADIKLALPQIALLLNNNDIAARQSCVALADFLPLGGIRIVHNRLHTVTGQALVLNAWPLAANVQLNTFAWRYLVATIERLLESIEAAIKSDTSLPPAALLLAQTLVQLVKDWSTQAEGWLEADYRVESNTIRSRVTAIESNLFELAVVNNHITMHEQPVSGSERIRNLGTLAESEKLAPLAGALRRGRMRDVRGYGARIAANPELLRTAATRREVAEAAGRLSAGDDPRVRDISRGLTAAITARDESAVRIQFAKLFVALRQQFDSYGISLEGAGCRVIGNQIVVPPDTNPETWARGGLRIDIDPQQFALAVVLALAGDSNQPADVIGITETLVEGNEIIGGAGHGIEVRGDGDAPAALFDLNVHANQVRGMAGAGILVEETILAAGVDIADNRIINCSGVAALAELTDASGGIVGRNILFGRLHGNRVTGCGAGQEAKGAWGIDLDTVYHAALVDNAVQSNGAESSNGERSTLNGGVRVTRAFGEIGVKQCELVWNRGLALWIDNTARDDDSGHDEASLTAMRLALIMAYLKRTAQTAVVPAGPDTASVQGNRMEGPGGKWAGVAEAVIGQQSLLGLVQQVAAVLMSNNSLAGGIFWILGEQRGVVSGNLAAPGGIIVQNPENPVDLVDGLNLPPVSRI